MASMACSRRCRRGPGDLDPRDGLFTQRLSKPSGHLLPDVLAVAETVLVEGDPFVGGEQVEHHRLLRRPSEESRGGRTDVAAVPDRRRQRIGVAHDHGTRRRRRGRVGVRGPRADDLRFQAVLALGDRVEVLGRPRHVPYRARRRGSLLGVVPEELGHVGAPRRAARCSASVVVPVDSAPRATTRRVSGVPIAGSLEVSPKGKRLPRPAATGHRGVVRPATSCRSPVTPSSRPCRAAPSMGLPEHLLRGGAEPTEADEELREEDPCRKAGGSIRDERPDPGRSRGGFGLYGGRGLRRHVLHARPRW